MERRPADEALKPFREQGGFGSALGVLEGNPLPHALDVRPKVDAADPAHMESLRRYIAAWPGVELVLAGHSHGGQVVLPGGQPLWLPFECGGYVAGWYDHEFRGYGYDFLPAADRIRVLRETVEIVKALWSEPDVSYQGRHFTLCLL